MIQKGAIAAVVEPELPKEDLEANDQKLLQAVVHHDWVICELFRQGPVLPLRFGTYFPGEAALHSHLEASEAQYQQRLTALAEKVEVTLKLTAIPFSPEHRSPSSQKGKAYLQAKKQQYREQSNYQHQQKVALENFQHAIAQTCPQLIHDDPKDGKERFYVLIDRATLPQFLEQMEQWQQEFLRWTLEVSEPLPPYHFL